MALTKVRGSGIDADGQEIILDADTDTTITADTDDQIDIKTGGSDRLTIDSSGNVGIGTSSPDFPLDIEGSVADDAISTVFRISADDPAASGEHAELQIKLGNGVSSTGDRRVEFHAFSNNGSDNRNLVMNPSGGATIFGNTYTGIQVAGVSIENTGNVDIGAGVNPLDVNRQTNDGSLIRFYQAGSEEGEITVSGSTVSLSGFQGSHESSGIPSDTPVGTVVSTIDTVDTKTIIAEDGSESQQDRADHPKIEVSNSVGDKAVYGVFARWRTIEENEDVKAMIASVGTGSVRVTGACAKGDLLESNGDGTAKVQDDDIVRSKTIGKVTIGNSNSGVKLVSCVLYCG